jgi:hypothetical protein
MDTGPVMGTSVPPPLLVYRLRFLGFLLDDDGNRFFGISDGVRGASPTVDEIRPGTSRWKELLSSSSSSSLSESGIKGELVCSVPAVRVCVVWSDSDLLA